MTLNQFLTDNSIKLERVQKLYLGLDIKRKAKKDRVRYKKVEASEDELTFWVLDYPDEWFTVNAPEIIINFMKELTVKK